MIVVTMFSNMIFFHLYIDQKQVSQQLEQRLAESELKLNASNQDKGILISSKIAEFDDNEFGYSLHNIDVSEMEVNLLWYRGEEIVQRKVILDQKTRSGHSITLTSWDFRDLEPSKQRVFDELLNSLPTEKKENSIQYVNPFEIQFTRSCGELSTKNNLTSTRTVYLQISGQSCTGLNAETLTADIINSTRELEIVADNINIW